MAQSHRAVDVCRSRFSVSVKGVELDYGERFKGFEFSCVFGFVVVCSSCLVCVWVRTTLGLAASQPLVM